PRSPWGKAAASRSQGGGASADSAGKGGSETGSGSQAVRSSRPAPGSASCRRPDQARATSAAAAAGGLAFEDPPRGAGPRNRGATARTRQAADAAASAAAVRAVA